MGILDLTALELGRKIKAKEITSVEAVQAVLEQIRKQSRRCMPMYHMMKRVH